MAWRGPVRKKINTPPQIHFSTGVLNDHGKSKGYKELTENQRKQILAARLCALLYEGRKQSHVALTEQAQKNVLAPKIVKPLWWCMESTLATGTVHECDVTSKKNSMKTNRKYWDRDIMVLAMEIAQAAHS